MVFRRVGRARAKPTEPQKMVSHVGWATLVQRHFFNEEAVALKGLCPPYLN